MDEKKHILLLEDEEALTKVISFHLKQKGFDVTIAFDGDQGLEAFRSGQFDAILLDLIMPRLDGFAFLEEVRSVNADLPIVVLSNLSQDSDRKKVERFGINKYFLKSDDTIHRVLTYLESLFS